MYTDDHTLQQQQIVQLRLVASSMLASSPFSITFGITFLKCPIYLQHLCSSIVPQKARIPSINSCLLFGLMTTCK